MPDEKDTKDIEVVVSSIGQVLAKFTDDDSGIGLTIAISTTGEGREMLVIGFHKDYVLQETYNAIAFSVDLATFKEVLEGIERRRVN